MKKWYALFLIFGLGIVVYVYGVIFDEWSEDQLVNFTPIWLLPMAYGGYGLAAEWAISLVRTERAENLTIAAILIARATFFIGLIPLIPFLFIRASMDSRVVALVSVVFWTIIYFIITKGIWHLL